ncbi:MAG: LacI family DNA-binding transcriptional regulator [Bryobacteraceae bacterium]
MAARAGVSTATVSRVLTGVGNVRDDLALRVRQVAEELRYQPNRLARNLRARETHIIGIVVPYLDNVFYAGMLRGAEEILGEAGYSILLGIYYDAPERERNLTANLRAESMAGLIFAPGIEPEETYSPLLEAGLPMVAVSRLPGDLPVDVVSVTNMEGAEEAVTHLIELGHRRIAIINGPLTVSTAHDRKRGYAAALDRAGLPMDDHLQVESPWTQEGGFAAMKQLLQSTQRPTAVFCAGHLQTAGALQAIREASLQVPRDIAIVGFDDVGWALCLNPTLTTVSQPAGEVGREAAKLLLSRMQDPERAPQHLRLATELRIRESCGSLRAVGATA